MWTAERIKALRKRYDMTQQEFAELCRVDVTTIRFWEQGRGLPSGPSTYVFDHLDGTLPENPAERRELQTA